jgi:hypothetical protein
LIEGRLDDVKRQFKTNSFEVLSDLIMWKVWCTISLKFTVGPANFKSLGKELKLEVQLEMLCLMNYYRYWHNEDKWLICGEDSKC